LPHTPGAQGRAQPAQGPDIRKISARHPGCLDPPPGFRVAIDREEIVRRRRSGRRDRIDEIHGDNRLADHGEAPETSSANGHIRIIGIRYFDKRHEFFETLDPCRRHE
jgi:hypothetical protein